jgi:hypothetical protein
MPLEAAFPPAVWTVLVYAVLGTLLRSLKRNTSWHL